MAITSDIFEVNQRLVLRTMQTVEPKHNVMTECLFIEPSEFVMAFGQAQGTS